MIFTHYDKHLIFISIWQMAFLTSMTFPIGGNSQNNGWPEKMQILLDNTAPLEYDRGDRLPLYLWSAKDLGDFEPDRAEELVAELNRRGIGVVCSWKKNDVEGSLSRGLAMAMAQKKLGQRVNIDATSLLYGFYIDDKKYGHIDENGDPFFDKSFPDRYVMGCPFTLSDRKDTIRDRVRHFLQKYHENNLPVDFIFADWEIDGPIEVNQAYETSKRCVRCRNHLGDDFTFDKFIKSMRMMRSYLQYYSYSRPVLEYYPNALVSNYAVYPNDGYRYWYDYFEKANEVHPYKSDQKAKYREWYNDFSLTGYTFAMPVVYPWWQIHSWYDFGNRDYRWFYNMLLNANNAGKSTPHSLPVISFVHWNTVFAGAPEPHPNVGQISERVYQELLWHMLLRGTNTFFMWSSSRDFPKETRLVHEVYAAAQEYGAFLEQGWPVTFEVPDEAGVVISGLALDDRVLIRRTDFGNDHSPVKILVGTRPITVNYVPGVCQIYKME